MVEEYTDEEGFVSEEDILPMRDDIYSKGLQLKKDNVVKNVLKSPQGSVTFYLPDETGFIFMPQLKHQMSGGYYVGTVDTLNSEETKQAKDLWKWNGQPILTQAAGNIVDNSSDYLSVDALSETAGGLSYESLIQFLDSLKNGSDRVLIWRGHGAVPFSTKSKTEEIGLVIHDTIDQAFREKWKEDIGKELIIPGNSDMIILTPGFFQKYLPEVHGGAVLCGSCYGYYTDSLKDVFLQKGFDTFIGASSSINDYYSDEFIIELSKNLTEKTSSGEYVSIQEAFQNTQDQVGSSETAYISRRLTMGSILGALTDYIFFGDAYFKIAQNSPLDEYVFRLVPRKRTLKGTIRDKISKEPLAGADITVSNPALEGSWHTLSDAQGNYSIDDVYAGSLKIKLSAEDYCPDTFSLKTEDYIYPGAVEEDFMLAPESQISGTVLLKKDRSPTSDAVVTLYQNGVEKGSVSTSEEGGFAFRKVESGSCEIVITKTGFSVFKKSCVVRNTTVDIGTVFLNSQHTIFTGTVLDSKTGEGIRGVSVTGEISGSGKAAGSCSSSPNGRFSLDLGTLNGWEEGGRIILTFSADQYEPLSVTQTSFSLYQTNELGSISLTPVQTYPIWDGSVASGYAGGDGTQANPYQIQNGEQLALLAKEVNDGNSHEGDFFLLTKDIFLNDVSERIASVWRYRGNGTWRKHICLLQLRRAFSKPELYRWFSPDRKDRRRTERLRYSDEQKLLRCL